MARSILHALVVVTLARWANTACVPDVPEKQLADPQVLNHPAVLGAFDEVEKALQKPYDANSTRDGFSLAVVRFYVLYRLSTSKPMKRMANRKL